MACDPPDDPDCDDDNTAHARVGVSAILGIGQAVGVNAGVAFDDQNSALYFEILFGAGLGFSAGAFAGVNQGRVDNMNGGFDLVTAEGGPITLTGAASFGGGSATLPDSDGRGSGLSGSAGRLQMGLGIFATRSHVFSAQGQMTSNQVRRCISMAVGLGPSC